MDRFLTVNDRCWPGPLWRRDGTHPRPSLYYTLGHRTLQSPSLNRQSLPHPSKLGSVTGFAYRDISGPDVGRGLKELMRLPLLALAPSGR